MESTPKNPYHDTITDKEQEAIVKFKATLATEKDLVPPSLLEDNDTLICFLRARKCDIAKSKKMIMDYLKWRIDYKVEDIYSNYVLDTIHELTIFYPHNFHKTAKNGEPLYIQILGDLKIDELFRVAPLESIVKYSTQQYERMVRDVFPACSVAAGKYVHGLFSIIDLKKLNRHLVCKKVYNLIQADMTICQNYYPESLGESYIINAGFLFKTMYTIVKAFLDAKTRSKIKIFGSNYQSALLEKIDKENLPTVLGGTCTCPPEGCLFSCAGPRRKLPTPPVTEEIVKKRKALMESLADKKKKKGDKEEEPSDEGEIKVDDK